MLNWYRRWKYAEGRYWKFDDKLDVDQNAGILILKGKYKGTLYMYGVVTPKENGEVFFSIRRIDVPTDTNLPSDFIEITKHILMIIIRKMLSGDNRLNRGLKAGEEYEDGEDRKNYIEESVEQRTVHKRNPRVPHGRAIPRQGRKNTI